VPVLPPHAMSRDEIPKRMMTGHRDCHTKDVKFRSDFPELVR
jgi:hypothetical protein